MHGYKIVEPGGTVVAQVVIDGDRVEIGLYGDKHYLSRTLEPGDALVFGNIMRDVATQLLTAAEEKDTTEHGQAQ